MKHSKSAQPRQRHVYMSTDCLHINWKDPKEKLLPKNRMKVFKLFAVVKGCTTPQLQRKTLLGKQMAKEELAFSIIGSDEDSELERSVDLEAASNNERDKWVQCINEVIEWAKAKKLYGQRTLKIQ